MDNGDLHGRTIRAASNDSPGSKNPIAQATWSILEERRALQAKAALEEADRCTRELPAVIARKDLEARLAEYQDCYEMSMSASSLFTTYHLLIMLDGISVLKAAIDGLNENINGTVSYCKIRHESICRYDIVLAVVMAMFGTRSAQQIIAANIISNDIFSELDLNGLL